MTMKETWSKFTGTEDVVNGGIYTQYLVLALVSYVLLRNYNMQGYIQGVPKKTKTIEITYC
jgi:hypothetical protein